MLKHTKHIVSSNISAVYPDVIVALKILIATMASIERSFSK